MNFDQILSAIGGFGKYQKILYIWICLPQILLAFHMMVSIFTGATPPFHCRESPSPVSGNKSSFPGTLSLNFSLLDSPCFSSDVLPQGNRTERVPCGHGWVYSKETFQSTTVTEVQQGAEEHDKYDLCNFPNSCSCNKTGAMSCSTVKNNNESFVHYYS